MTTCIVCMEPCVERHHPPPCAGCFYYIHEPCRRRATRQLPFACLYCRRRAPRCLDDDASDAFQLDEVISFEDDYFVFVGTLVGTAVATGVSISLAGVVYASCTTLFA